MALAFKVQPYHPFCSYRQFVPGSRFLDDLWTEIALAYEQEAQNTCCGQRQKEPAQRPITIASVPLKQYKPEEISLDIDDKKITLHGQHRSEDENGFENSEFTKVIELPEGVDPRSVTSRPSLDGRALVLKGIKRVEKNEEQENGRFLVKLDLSGFKAEEINVQLRGQELTVIGKQKSEDSGFQWSRHYHRRIVLPDDADLGSVKSSLSKEGLLTIEASRDPALLPSQRNVDVTVEESEPQAEDEAKQIGGESAEGEQN